MKFPRVLFERFCSALTINSKELGRVRLRWNGSQQRFIDEIQKGLDEDVHKFVILKARQLGITTVGCALDLFWLFRNKGVQGALAGPGESTRELCRNILTGYLNSLPPNWKYPVKKHNRTELSFAHESRLAYLVAGGKNSGMLARGEGLNFLHATELSSWSDDEGIISLDASLAEQNPDRLYIYESTARGFNVFHDMWRDAIRSRTTRAVFIGWWARQEYAIREGTRLWPTYGRQRLTREEREWHNDVKKLYGYEITPEQWAWWRWKWAEKGESKLLLAEYPFTADQAFVMTGSEFFPLGTLQQIYQNTQDLQRTCWNYRLGKNFEDTELYEDPDGALSIWEEPDPKCDYVISADPAYGESDWADCFSVQVLKCTAHTAVQVAEFSSPDCTMYGFAWILAHLAGAYSSIAHPPTVILELGGPGRGVLQELQRMPTQYANKIEGLSDHARAKLQDFFGSIQHYLYRRPDTLSGSTLLQWETTFRTKTLMMNSLRDAIERGMLRISSPEFVDEARFVTQNGSSIQAEGRTHKDDRVVAMGLGVVAWQQQLLPMLLMRGGGDMPDMQNPVARSVANWLANVKINAENEQWRNAGVESWQD